MNRSLKYWNLKVEISKEEENITNKIQNSSLDEDMKEKLMTKFNEYVSNADQSINHLRDLRVNVEDFQKRKKKADSKLAGAKKRNKIALTIELIALIALALTSGIVGVDIMLLFSIISAVATGTYIVFNNKSVNFIDRVAVNEVKYQLESYKYAFDGAYEIVNDYYKELKKWDNFITSNDKKENFDNGLTKTEEKEKNLVKKK